MTALHHAVHDPTGMKLLLNQGVEVNRHPLLSSKTRLTQTQVDCRDHMGETPLFHAIRLGKLEPVWILLRAGASLDVTNKEGKKPADFSQGGVTKVIEEITAEMCEFPWGYTEHSTH